MFEGDLPNDCEQSKLMPLTSRPVAIQANVSMRVLFSITVIHIVQVVVVLVKINSCV